MQISSPAAIDAEIEEAENSLASGAELFIGGHGGAATRDAVEFKISYLKKMKRIVSTVDNTADFVNAMKKEYPQLPGEGNLKDLGEKLL